MEKHGSESYFVLGEGLLGESGEGLTLVVAAKAAPPFRFSRMGPKGTGRQPSRAIRKKLGELMAAGGGETSDANTSWPIDLSPSMTALPLIRLISRSALGPP